MENEQKWVVLHSSDFDGRLFNRHGGQHSGTLVSVTAKMIINQLHKYRF